VGEPRRAPRLSTLALLDPCVPSARFTTDE
jgi:hypothetical protein